MQDRATQHPERATTAESIVRVRPGRALEDLDLVLGSYRVVQRLSRGGMSAIDLGRHEPVGTAALPVVIKRLTRDVTEQDPDAVRYFVQEARILARLRHPGIVQLRAFGHERGAHVMVLEYVHGFDLGRWIRYRREMQNPIAVGEAISLVCSVLDALEHAHAACAPDGGREPVIHCDVTPSNVLLDATGKSKLADFGIAHVCRGDAAPATVLRGKPSYMAPELIEGGASSIASDVYSAALVLRTMLVGRNDLYARDSMETIRNVLTCVPSPLSSIRDDVPLALEAVLRCALAKDPAMRPCSARELRDELLAASPRSPLESRRDLRGSIRRDFEGDMAAVLGLAALSDIEAAWRRSNEWDADEA